MTRNPVPVPVPTSIISHRTRRFYRIARVYARAGIPVFPGSPETKAPLTEHGFKDATTSLQILEQRAYKYPDALVCAPTGEPSGITVLDFDIKCECATTPKEMLPQLPDTRLHETQSGGVHAVFAYTPSAGTIGARVIEPAPGSCTCGKSGIDLRNDGGYVVVPGSRMANGAAYKVIEKAPPAQLPVEILSKLKKAKIKKTQKASAPGAIFRQGERHAAAVSKAGSLRNRGLEGAEIELLLLDWNQAQCDPPMPEGEVRRIASDAGGWAIRSNNGSGGFRGFREVSGVDRNTDVELRNEVSGVSGVFVRTFPTETLPTITRNFCKNASEVIGVPIEMVALPHLAAAAAAIGNGARIKIKEGFEQPALVWVAVIAPPGTAKSPAQAIGTKPLRALQVAAHSKYEAEQTLYEVESKDRKQNTDPPRLKHYYTTDSTVEALAYNLEVSKGILIDQDELVSFVSGFNAYRSGRGGDRQAYMSIWASAHLKIDRRNKAKPIVIENPVVCIAGGIQPDIARQLQQDVMARDGFVERFLYSEPEVSPPEFTETEQDLELEKQVNWIFRDLEQINDQIIRVSPQAKKLYVSWYNSNQKAIEAANGIVGGYYSKLSNNVLRLALILHCLANSSRPQEPVSASVMADAIQLGEYFRSHAHKALYRFGGNLPVEESLGDLDASMYRWLADEYQPEGDSRDATSKRITPYQRKSALEHLEFLDLAQSRRSEPSNNGGRPTTYWRRNPENPENLISEFNIGVSVNPENLPETPETSYDPLNLRQEGDDDVEDLPW